MHREGPYVHPNLPVPVAKSMAPAAPPPPANAAAMVSPPAPGISVVAYVDVWNDGFDRGYRAGLIAGRARVATIEDVSPRSGERGA